VQLSGKQTTDSSKRSLSHTCAIISACVLLLEPASPRHWLLLLEYAPTGRAKPRKQRARGDAQNATVLPERARRMDARISKST
jgi:hypothetical protein